MKIAIIGAGASGILAAIRAKRLNKNLNIDLFDINKTVGKKILASGNGRCNISNVDVSYNNYIGTDPFFTNKCLELFDYKVFETFCKSIGLLLDIKDTNKVYPLSNEAKSVVNLLEAQLNYLNINIISECQIRDVKKTKDKFILKDEKKIYKEYDKVLISTGLQAAPQLNATDDGIDIGKTFSHTSSPIYPSLVGLNVDSVYHSKLSGVKKEVLLSLFINNTKVKDIIGDLLFTKYGVSGFAVLDISQEASYQLMLNQNIHLTVNFFPKLNKNELLSKLESIFKALPNEKIELLLVGLMPNKLPKVILELCNISMEAKAKDTNAKQIRSIVNQLINWKLKIVGTQGFKHAEVSGGGINTNEINDTTMESKKCKGLYFAGEVLDIVGQRGGFNLHFAWASGYMAGYSLSLNK